MVLHSLLVVIFAQQVGTVGLVKDAHVTVDANISFAQQVFIAEGMR